MIYSNNTFFSSFAPNKLKLRTKRNAKHKPLKATKVHVIILGSVGSYWGTGASGSAAPLHCTALPHGLSVEGNVKETLT